MGPGTPRARGRVRGAAGTAAAALAAALLLAAPFRLPAQANPFFGGPAPGAAPPAVSALPVASPALRALAGAQRSLREHLADVVVRSASGGAAVPALLGLALAYGLLHALGPGHRKVALAAYFLARPARPLQAVAAGVSIAFLHAAAALAAVYGLYYLFRGSVSVAFSSLSWILELGSYGAITLLGLVLLALSIRGWLRSRRGGHGACCGPAKEGRTLAAIVLGSGVVPCPGTALILILCLSQGLPWIGALAAMAVSAGMAVVTVSVSLAAVYGKRGLLSALPRGSRLGRLLHHGLEIGGAAVIVVFGLFMLAPYLAGLSLSG